MSLCRITPAFFTAQILTKVVQVQTGDRSMTLNILYASSLQKRKTIFTLFLRLYSCSFSQPLDWTSYYSLLLSFSVLIGGLFLSYSYVLNKS